jgi:hypothetical protein
MPDKIIFLRRQAHPTPSYRLGSIFPSGIANIQDIALADHE